MNSLPSSPYKQPYIFASGDGALVSAISSDLGDGTAVSYPRGVPTVYSVLPENGGKWFERGIVNAIGKMASSNSYASQIGYIYTYEPEIAEAIGGYAKGAVLRYTDANGNTGLVQSLIGNNKSDFVSDPSLIDGKNWMIISRNDAGGILYDVFPDYSKLARYEYKTEKPIKDLKPYTDPQDLYSITLEKDSAISLCAIIVYKNIQRWSPAWDEFREKHPAATVLYEMPGSFYYKQGDKYCNVCIPSVKLWTKRSYAWAGNHGSADIDNYSHNYFTNMFYMKKGSVLCFRVDSIAPIIAETSINITIDAYEVKP